MGIRPYDHEYSWHQHHGQSPVAREAVLVNGDPWPRGRAALATARSLLEVCAHLMGRERLLRMEGVARASDAEWPDLSESCDPMNLTLGSASQAGLHYAGGSRGTWWERPLS